MEFHYNIKLVQKYELINHDTIHMNTNSCEYLLNMFKPSLNANRSTWCTLVIDCYNVLKIANLFCEKCSGDLL